jgi:hypothetical protein
MTPEDYERAAGGFSEIETIQAGRRCGVWHAPWMGDWFTSWSPRNGNNNAEGPWEHWVDLAIQILRDPMTAKVRPEAHELAQQFQPGASERLLTDEELLERFAPEVTETSDA